MVFLSPSTWPALRPAKPPSVEATLEDRFLADFLERLIGDKAYDSDPLDDRLLRR